MAIFRAAGASISAFGDWSPSENSGSEWDADHHFLKLHSEPVNLRNLRSVMGCNLSSSRPLRPECASLKTMHSSSDTHQPTDPPPLLPEPHQPAPPPLTLMLTNQLPLPWFKTLPRFESQTQ
jgi:hypothetical protein